MFTEEIRNKILSHKDMKIVPVGYQETALFVIEEVLRQHAQEFPYIYLPHIFEGNITENLREV